MKVSVIVPAYNVEDCIEKSLNSIINQSYKDLEIIVINDASTDKTKEIVNNFSKKDKRIISLNHTKNKGVSAARNLGLEHATGDYILFVDSDDLLVKDAISKMVDISIKYDSDFVDNYHLFVYTKKNKKDIKFTEKKLPKKLLILGNIKENPKIITMSTYITGKLIKRNLLDGLSFDESLRCYEDMVLEHQVKSRIKNYAFMSEIVYIYCQRPTSLINSLGKNHLCFIDASKKVKEIYKNHENNIKEEIEAMLVSNMFLTCLTKVVKNEDTLENNTKLAREYLVKLKETFPNYKNNYKINRIIKKYIELFINNEEKLKKFIKKTNKINFINLYFIFLSLINKNNQKI